VRSSCTLPRFEAARDDVVGQFGHGRRDVGAQDVDLAERVELGRVLLLGELMRRPHRRLQPAPHEPDPQPVEFGNLAVEGVLALTNVLVPQPRNVDVAVRHVRGSRHRREQRCVLPADRCIEDLASAALDPAPQQVAVIASGVVATGGAELDKRAGVLLAEDVSEDAAAVVGVVDEEHEVPEAHERIGAVPGTGECLGGTVDVADHVKPHRASLGRRYQRPVGDDQGEHWIKVSARSTRRV